MRWSAKRKPQLGDRRERVVFAIVPRRCSDGYVYWLCRVRQTARWLPAGSSMSCRWQVCGYHPFRETNRRTTRIAKVHAGGAGD